MSTTKRKREKRKALFKVDAEKRKAAAKKKLASKILRLTDWYIKSVLKRTGAVNITPEMIEERRLVIMLKRKIDEQARKIDA